MTDLSKFSDEELKNALNELPAFHGARSTLCMELASRCLDREKLAKEKLSKSPAGA